MSEHRDEMPYEKAIEETAKTTGKALDMVQSMSPAIATAYGFIIGDRINAARERQLDSLARKTKKLLQDRNAKEEQPVPEQIAIPLLEAAQGETRETIQDLYAALLANAMDANYANDVRPEFVATVKALQPLDAAILAIVLRAHDTVSQRQIRYQDVSTHILGKRPAAVQLSVDHLVKLNCILSNQGMLMMTPYGQEFMVACDPHTISSVTAARHHLGGL